MSGAKIRNPILVIGGHFGGLYITREFGKRGIEVYVVASKKDNHAFNSKYCKQRIIAPEPWNCQDLKRILRKMSKVTTQRLVVYPVSDVDTLNLSIIKDELRDDYHIMAADREATETLVNKSKFYHALEKNHVEYPETFFPQDLATAKQIGKDICFPVFVRPAITQKFTDAFGPTKKGFIAKDYNELLDYYRLTESKKVEVMFQEIISGPPQNSLQLEGYFDKDFCSTGLFARQRLRIWPPDFGNTTLCVSIPISKFGTECDKMSQFIKNLNYNGVASAEYKKDPRDGRYKLLEINARTWFHSWLSAKCGVNILFSSYLDALGEKVEFNQVYTIGVKSIHIDYDFLSAKKMFQKGELSVLEWLLSLRGVRQAALLDIQDSYPFFVNILKNLNIFRTQPKSPNVPISDKEEKNKCKTPVQDKSEK